MSPWEERVARSAHTRHAGDEDVKRSLRAANEEMKDWYTTCRRCGVTLAGTLAHLREHRCDGP